MTELEILKRARLYIESLANGVNPLTDKPVAESDCVNNIRISRCLFYVSEVLEKVIRKGGPDGIKQKKLPFSITKEELEGYSLSEAPITISDMAAKISALKQSDTMRKIWYSDIASFYLFIAVNSKSLIHFSTSCLCLASAQSFPILQ